jgi:hypothetical protein
VAYDYLIRDSKAIHGFNVDTLCAFSIQEGQLKWVPIQVDERNPRGDYVLNEGEDWTAHSDSGLVDENDDVVLRREDFGTAISATFLEQNKSQWSGRSAIFAVKDLGEVLIVESSKDRPRQFSTVQFQDQKVESPYYRYLFHPRKAALLGTVFLRTPSQDLQIFTDSFYQFKFFTSWWLPNITIGDSDFDSHIESWKIGPIRTIIAVGVKYKAFFSMIQLHVFSELIFSERSFHIPSKIESPLNFSRILKEGSGLFYGIRMNQDLNWELKTDIDRWDNVIKDAKPKDQYYAMARIPEQGMAQVNIHVAKDLQRRQPIVFRKGDPIGDALPWVEKKDSDLAVFLDASAMRKGVYGFSLDLHISRGSELDSSALDLHQVPETWR